ncbi:MAG: ABC transporter ATP-binding protein/permease [Lachnospiraceae bacterium]|nr:ABC transporter ATP-binding protein/permease [Lachnospiraceae bacterium]
MLQLNNITKEYVTGDSKVQALKGISISFRKNEFVSILGPSGGGKTTLLNIIGGLDHYTSGDLVINGKSTKDFKDRDWDSYRNHSVGFVFQSYNLIPHQNVLSNVELALTLSGVGKAERRKRAKEALEAVGLADQIHKKPNQLSGGQMQRVAIARALVNNPEILLADEPTGALDTDTSIQVMDILKQVAKDRLVIMVTHNPELAEKYSTRIVKLRDGSLIDDTDPFDGEEKAEDRSALKKTSMNFRTALSLSLNNLMTKRARTLLTSFAGSIGIIGIALILAISTGVNNYINDIQKDTMSSYPITIDAQSIDLESVMQIHPDGREEEIGHDLNAIYSNGMGLEMMNSMTSSIQENNLTNFKKYLDDPDSEIHQYIGENGISYSYNVKFDVYTRDPDGTMVNIDGSTINPERAQMMSSAQMAMMSSMTSASMQNCEEIMADQGDERIGGVIKDNYELVYGEWPENYDEVVVVLDEHNEIHTMVLYQLGLLPVQDYKEMREKLNRGEEVENKQYSWSYQDICDKIFYAVPACDYYQEKENGTFFEIEDEEELETLAENSIQLKVSGIIRLKEDADTRYLTQPIGYTKALTDYLIDYCNESAVVKAQRENPDTNVLSGFSFTATSDEEKIEIAREYMGNLSTEEKAAMIEQMLESMGGANSAMGSRISQMSQEQKASIFDQSITNADDQNMLTSYDRYISQGTYDENMSAFGAVNLEAPSSISIYADSFESKDAISECIDNYNKEASEEDQIVYTDYVGLLMSSITTIINAISYVLIAFVAVSLIVSSIMIGIITYISVLERTKEIGILRAIGASKKDISRVFNAETFLVGLCAGLIGVGISSLLCIPINAVIRTLVGEVTVTAVVPFTAGVILVAISIGLTLIAGLFPSKVAAKKDPVTALRTE